MKIKAVTLGAAIKTFIFSENVPLKALLDKWRYPKKDESVFINNNKALNFNIPLKNGDIVTIVFPVRGAAPPPLMSKFIRFLECIGFEFYHTGKGDHEIWINERGTKLTVNPNRRDKRYIDRASVDKLKKILNCTEGDLIRRINNL